MEKNSSDLVCVECGKKAAMIRHNTYQCAIHGVGVQICFRDFFDKWIAPTVQLRARIALLEALADAIAAYVDEDGKGWTPGNYQALKAALAMLETAS